MIDTEREEDEEEVKESRNRGKKANEISYICFGFMHLLG